MADLGTIGAALATPLHADGGVTSTAAHALCTGQVRGGSDGGNLIPGRRAYNANYSLINSSPTKTISGTVTENGVAVQDVWVMCFHRPSGVCVGRTRTSSTGAFSFSALDDGEQYFCVALDPDGGVSYDALVYDKINPV